MNQSSSTSYGGRQTQSGSGAPSTTLVLDRGEIPRLAKTAGMITTQNLLELVWKYFDDEIHETLLEAQESLAAENLKSRKQLTHRNQEGK